MQTDGAVLSYRKSRSSACVGIHGMQGAQVFEPGCGSTVKLGISCAIVTDGSDIVT